MTQMFSSLKVSGFLYDSSFQIEAFRPGNKLPEGSGKQRRCRGRSSFRSSTRLALLLQMNGIGAADS